MELKLFEVCMLYILQTLVTPAFVTWLQFKSVAVANIYKARGSEQHTVIKSIFIYRKKVLVTLQLHISFNYRIIFLDVVVLINY